MCREKRYTYLFDGLLGLAGHVDVQLVVLVDGHRPPPGALLDRALAADGDLAVRLSLHPLLGVAPRPDDETCSSEENGKSRGGGRVRKLEMLPSLPGVA